MIIELGIGGIGLAVVAMFYQIEHRLTKLETKMEDLIDGIQKGN